MATQTEDPVLGIDGIKGEEENNKPIDKVVGLVGEEGGQGERDMAPSAGNLMHRSGSRPQLDLSKAAIQGNFEERNPTILLPNQSDDIFHLALDIGGIVHLCFFQAIILVIYWFCFFFLVTRYDYHWTALVFVWSLWWWRMKRKGLFLCILSCGYAHHFPMHVFFSPWMVFLGHYTAFLYLHFS
jgi:hypothetical protein